MFLDKFKKNLPGLILVLFLVVGFTVYANSFNNGFFWDDDDLITNNVFVQRFDIVKFFTKNEIAGVGQVSNYWRPLLLVSFAIDYKLWGLHPIGFHLTNTLLHVSNAWLLFLIFGFLISSRLNRREGWVLSFLAALLFLIHPLQTEAVTYVSGRGDPLSTLFSLLSIGAYIVFREKNKVWSYVLAIVFLIAGLLMKEQVVFLPLLFVLLEFVFYREDNIKKSALSWLRSLWPFFAVSVIYVILRLTIFNFNDLLSGVDGQVGDYSQANVWQRVLTFSSVMLSYFKLLFIPTGLHMAREVETVKSVLSWPVGIFLFLVIGLSCLSFKLWKKEKLIAFGLLWFAVILLPRTNIIAINRPMYEHWLYLPMFGFWLAVLSIFCLFHESLRSIKAKNVFKVFCIVIFSFFIFLFSSLTVLRNIDWRDPITFYEKNLSYTPNNYIQLNNLAMAYADVGRNSDAIETYRKSLAIADIYPQVHHNLANSLAAIGSSTEAEAEYRRAIEMSPEFYQAYINLITILVGEGRIDDAKQVLGEAEGVFADIADFWYLKGVIYYSFGEFDEALSAMKRAASLNPKNEEYQEIITNLSLNKDK